MALEVTALKHHWLEVVACNDHGRWEETEFLVRKTPFSETPRRTWPLGQHKLMGAFVVLTFT